MNVYMFLVSAALIIGQLGATAMKDLHYLPWSSLSLAGLRCPQQEWHYKNVTLKYRNVLKSPLFDFTIFLKNIKFKYLIGMMEHATDMSTSYRFTATYFNTTLGYFINAINNVFGTYSVDYSYWQILDGQMKPIPVGVSNYVPQNNETVTFNLTVGSH